MTEADWKHLRTVKDAALQRFCERVLRDAQEIATDEAHTPHERYGALYGLMRDRDRELANAFDDLSRSTADMRLLAMRRLGVVTDEEMQGFSPGVRDFVEEWVKQGYGTRSRARSRVGGRAEIR